MTADFIPLPRLRRKNLEQIAYKMLDIVLVKALKPAVANDCYSI